MFKRLLVPLDGSHLAEAALPAAAYLAQNLGMSVTLVHIIEHNAPHAVHGERHLTNAEEAHTYLDEVARRAFPPTIPVERHVHTTEVTDVPRGIVDHVHELAPDLIVMCTHGEGGLHDLLFGSIAQRVVSHGTIPVLLIQPEDRVELQPFACHNLLVPLDGLGVHDEGLKVATELAKGCSAEMYLLVVIPTMGTLSGNQAATGRLLPGATRAILEMACIEADTYLSDRVARLQREGLTVKAELKRGDPADMVFETSEGDTVVDMIVLGTHGTAGFDAFYSGAIAPKIVSRSRVPLLLVPVSS